MSILTGSQVPLRYLRYELQRVKVSIYGATGVSCLPRLGGHVPVRRPAARHYPGCDEGGWLPAPAAIKTEQVLPQAQILV